MSASLLAEVRRFVERLVSGGNGLPLRMTGVESLAVAQVEPSGAEMTRAGRRFTLGNTAAITGIANATALVTTAAQFVIWNLDPRKTLVFEEVGMYLTSGTPGAGGVLLAAVVPAPTTNIAVGTYAGTKISNCNPGSSKASAVVVKESETLDAAPCWYPIADNDDSNVGAFPGSATLVNRDLNGRFVVPPRCGLALAVIGLAGTTPLWAPFAQWIEIDTDNE